MRGFSLIELLIALAILSTTLVAVSLVAFGTPGMLERGRQEVRAGALAEAILAQQTGLAQTDFPSIVPLATSTETGGFSTALSIETLPDTFTKRLTASVSFSIPFQGTRTVSLPLLITDPKAALGSDPCSSTLAGDWTHPTASTHSFSAGSLLPATFSAGSRSIASLFAFQNMLAVTLDPAAGKTDPTLYLFLIPSTSHIPSYIGSIDNAPTTKDGFAALAYDPPYLFAANAHAADWSSCKEGTACSQLQVIDISNPSNPVLARSYALASTSAPYALGSGGQSTGKSLAYRDGYLYVGLTKSSAALGQEFVILDVHDPIHPQLRGGFSVGRTVNHITLAWPYAYLATDDNTRELIVLDVKDPAAPTLVRSWNAPGSTSFGYGRDVALWNGFTYFARSYVSNAPELYTLDQNLAPLSSIDIGTALFPRSAVALRLRDQLLTVLTSSEVQWYTPGATGALSPAALSIPLPTGTTGAALTCSGNYLYVAGNEANGNGTITVLTGS